MTPTLSSSDFELFGLPDTFAQDSAAIDARWKELQREVHPDKFAAQGASAQRVAMQWSVRVNEAYQRLRDPLKRAAYLCELRGAPIDAHSNTAMPAAFLMQQMEWREAVADARGSRDRNALEALRTDLAAAHGEMLGQLERAIDRESNYDAGCSLVRKLRFLEKLEEEIDEALE